MKITDKQKELLIEMRDNKFLFIEQRAEIPKGKFAPKVYTYLTEGASCTDKRISYKLVNSLYELNLLKINSMGLDLKLNPDYKTFISSL